MVFHIISSPGSSPAIRSILRSLLPFSSFPIFSPRGGTGDVTVATIECHRSTLLYSIQVVQALSSSSSHALSSSFCQQGWKPGPCTRHKLLRGLSNFDYYYWICYPECLEHQSEVAYSPARQVCLMFICVRLLLLKFCCEKYEEISSLHLVIVRPFVL